MIYLPRWQHAAQTTKSTQDRKSNRLLYKRHVRLSL